jgi:hypothetical protein
LYAKYAGYYTGYDLPYGCQLRVWQYDYIAGVAFAGFHATRQRSKFKIMPQKTERQKQKNWALLAVLLTLAIILFITTIIKFGHMPPVSA